MIKKINIEKTIITKEENKSFSNDVSLIISKILQNKMFKIVLDGIDIHNATIIKDVRENQQDLYHIFDESENHCACVYLGTDNISRIWGNDEDFYMIIFEKNNSKFNRMYVDFKYGDEPKTKKEFLNFGTHNADYKKPK